MGPTTKSRKGKKAWRKNIDASEVEASLTEKAYQERRGPAAAELKDDQLFFVDTTADVEGAAAVAEGRRPAKRRREEVVAKPLRAQQIIAEAHKARPVAVAPPARKPTAPSPAAAAAAKGALVPAAGAKRAPVRGAGGAAKRPHALDLWADEDLGQGAGAKGAAAAAGPGSAALARLGQEQAPKPLRSGVRRVGKSGEAVAVAAGAAAVRTMGPSAKRLRGGPEPQARIAALAVDVPGCSFNPDTEQHQDALALLVAAELKKELRREMAPTAPPREVEGGAAPLTELEALQVEAADSDDDEEGDDAAGRGGEGGPFDPNAIALTGADGDSDDEGPGGAGAAGKRKVEKKSKKDRSKEARRKAADLEAEERKKLKAQRRELHSLREVKQQLEEEKQLQDTKRERLQSLRVERSAVQPPRLGKLRFEAPAVQVLTSDEKTGSLRQVLPCAMLAADRFKSLQQRGLVEPRKPQPFKERRRKVGYEKGGRAEKQEAASDEVRAMGRQNKKARLAAKAAFAATGADDWL